MEEVDYDKILEELTEIRKRRSLTTCIRPTGPGSTLILGASQGIHPVRLDFRSLYPNITMRFGPQKNITRKKKIRNIFPDIENPSI